MIKKGDIKKINYYVKRLSPIPKIGDIVNTEILNYKAECVILNYLEVSWTSKAELKVSCSVKILELEEVLQNSNIKLLK
ncbi:hypothetical protein P9265_14985 [Schinkia azotoformans]|uniref:hypothetical protein n=1 Tax=Schinkia azotoformans TaxID=1454 RepID=UPI002E1B8DF1|nr:hypothetical protein [Schinkia azotoformans]